MLKKHLSAFILAILTITVHAAPKFYTLKNGLQVILLQDQRAPIVTVQAWYKVGSSDEKLGTTGISHALEHMMFRGNNKDHSKIIAQLGGSSNAFTSRDYTAYYQTVPKKSLKSALDLEAKRMQNLTFSKDDLKKEMQAVLEERRMRVDDNPVARAMETFYNKAFASNPYAQPIIGWEHDIKQYTSNDIKSWHNRWYSPNNAIIVVAGDIDYDQALNFVKKAFATIPKKNIIIKKSKTQKNIFKTRMEVVLPVASPHFVIAFHAPTVNNLDKNKQWQSYALILLSALLTNNDSGILQITDTAKIFNSIHASYQPFSRNDVLFMIMGQINQGKSANLARSFILQQLKKVMQTKISFAELQKVKTMFFADHIFNKDSLSNQAKQYGALAALNLPLDIEDKFIKNLENITVEQIQLVAKKFFINEISMTIKPSRG